MLDPLGVSGDFLPPLVDAGRDLGAAIAAGLPPPSRALGSPWPGTTTSSQPSPAAHTAGALPRLDGHRRSAAAGPSTRRSRSRPVNGWPASHQRGAPRRAGQARGRRRCEDRPPDASGPPGCPASPTARPGPARRLPFALPLRGTLPAGGSRSRAPATTTACSRYRPRGRRQPGGALRRRASAHQRRDQAARRRHGRRSPRRDAPPCSPAAGPACAACGAPVRRPSRTCRLHPAAGHRVRRGPRCRAPAPP